MAPTPGSRDADEDALLARIHADLDDDGPRLVYADWLTTRGDPRGEYIALELRGARRKPKQPKPPQPPQPPQALPDRWRADEARWLGPLAGLVDTTLYRRGFLSSCRYVGSPSDWVDTPLWGTVETLELPFPAADLPFWERCAASKLSALRRVGVVSWEGAARIAAVAPRLRHIAVDASDLRSGAHTNLAGLRELRRIDLVGAPSDELARAQLKALLRLGHDLDHVGVEDWSDSVETWLGWFAAMKALAGLSLGVADSWSTLPSAPACLTVHRMARDYLDFTVKYAPRRLSTRPDVDAAPLVRLEALLLDIRVLDRDDIDAFEFEAPRGVRLPPLLRGWLDRLARGPVP